MRELKIGNFYRAPQVKARATRANVEKFWEDWDEVVEVFYDTHSRGCAGSPGLRGEQFLRRYHFDFADHRQRDYQQDATFQRRW